MNRIDTKGLLLRIFIPTSILGVIYVVLGHICQIPQLLLFCFLFTMILVPIELGSILWASKKEYGTYSLRSAFDGQEKIAVWKVMMIAIAFCAIAGVLSAVIAPIENRMMAEARNTVLSHLPAGFDWTNYEYLKSFPKSIRILTCVYYGIFNVFVGPITEELYFRGYLTSHYEKQNSFTPIVIAVLFSLYHFWLPFDNVFRILAFAPVAYIAYKKKNLYISICFHCICNLFSVVGFVLEVL